MANLSSRPGKGSMVGGDTPATRAQLNAAVVVNGEPTVGDGVDCTGWRWACVTLFSAATTSSDFAFWTYDANSGKYVRDNQLGDGGTITVVTATEGGLERHWFELSGVDEFYTELEALNGGVGSGASAWVTLSM